MKNIVLIGMPGTGKSTVGVLLAKSLLMDFCDTDLIIQKKYSKLSVILQSMLLFRLLPQYAQLSVNASVCLSVQM